MHARSVRRGSISSPPGSSFIGFLTRCTGTSITHRPRPVSPRRSQVPLQRCRSAGASIRMKRISAAGQRTRTASTRHVCSFTGYEPIRLRVRSPSPACHPSDVQRPPGSHYSAGNMAVDFAVIATLAEAVNLRHSPVRWQFIYDTRARTAVYFVTLDRGVPINRTLCSTSVRGEINEE